MSITLVRGRWVFPSADVPAVEDGAVVVDGDMIVAVLPYAEAQRRHPEAPVVGSQSAAILPGFINAHHHGQAVTAVQHGMPEESLEPWLLAWAGMRDSDRYLDTLLSGARLLSTGVTTTIDMWSDGSDSRTYADAIRAARAGYGDAGIRVAFAPGIKTQSFMAWGSGEDERFVASLSAGLQADARRIMPRSAIDADDYFAIMAELRAETSAADRFSLWFQFPGPQWVSDQFMQRVAERAAADDTGIQTHVDESIPERLHGRRFYGVDTMVHLERLGVLSDRLSIAHGVWLTDAEIEAMQRTGAGLSHNPGSNLRLFAGIAPLARLLEAGIPIGIGMDATTLDDSEDMFAEIRLALRLCRDPMKPGRFGAVTEIFRLATEGGARLLRRHETLGRLLPGFRADLTVVDLERLSAPWSAPEADPLSLVLLRASRDDVDTVMVAGEVVFTAGRPTRFDIDAAGRQFAEKMAAAVFPAERAAAVRRLTPHLKAWYTNWGKFEPAPYVIYNSRR